MILWQEYWSLITKSRDDGRREKIQKVAWCQFDKFHEKINFFKIFNLILRTKQCPFLIIYIVPARDHTQRDPKQKP